ncbi:MAG: phage tail tape measure protein [Lachnospirales bacterium]
MADIGKTINTILNLTDKFTPKLSAAGKEALIFKEKLKNCNTAANSIDKGLSKLAKTAVVAGATGVAAMGAFAKSSLDTYKDFQQSMSNVAGILSVDTTSETYKKLESAAREAGKSTTKTAQESADALSYMALAGWSVEDSMNGLMPILRASEATGADLATTSDLVTDSMSALGLQTNELNHYLDVCARAQNKSNTTLTQMQEAYIGCGATFKNFNTELDESGALLGVIANRGIKGSEAGNSLQSTLVNLTKQSGESYKAMQALGVSAYDSQGKFKGVSNVLLELNDKTKNLTEEQRNNYLTMIAGKTQLTTLNALMAGLTNTLSNGKTEFQDLREQLQSCNGSLDKMANTMTNNLSGAMARAQSATDDFKITIGKKLEPYVTRFFNWFSAKLPNATEKFATILDNKVPRAINFCKNAFEKTKPVVTFVIRNFSELAIAGGTVVAGLKAFSIAVKVSSFMSKLKGAMVGLTTAQKLATICQTAFNTSLLACPLTWLVAGIAAVGAGILVWKKHLEKADIAKHFGDITLSAEECSDIVKNVFGNEFIDRIENVNSATEGFKQSLKSTTESARKLNKLNFKIEFGGTVSQEDYMSAVDEYVANLQEAVRDKQYSLSLNIDLLFDNSGFGNAFSADANGYYGQLSEQAKTLGEDLKAAAKNAYEHNWDLDSTEAVAAIMKQQAEIQEKIATAQSEAKLETLKLDFQSGDLSQESFQNLIDATNEELANLKETYSKARIDAIAQAKLMYTDGSTELTNAIQQANDAYNQKMDELTAKGLQFENDAIMGAFPEISEALKNSLSSLNELYGEDFLNGIADGSIPFSESTVSIFTRELENAFSSVAPETRKHIGELYESMMPSADELLNSMKNMEKVPQVYANVFAQNSAIGAVGNNSKALKELGVTTLSTVLPTDITRVLGSSKTYGDSYAKGIQANENSAKTAAERLRTQVVDTLSKSININVPVNVSGTVKTTTQTTTPKTDNNATGTTYFGGGLTTINEHGYEVIDLPQGTRIYPHSQSEKMMNNNSPNVSVSVNVNGNIFGLENAAELIGGMVCDKIVESIKAV